MIWLISDTHFGLKGDNPIWMQDIYDYFDKVLFPLMEEKVEPEDILIHCGDVFDNRSTIGLNTISTTIKIFERLSNIFNKIKIVIGNHDIYKKTDTSITSVDMLKHIKNIDIYYTPTVETIDDKRVLFLPWNENAQEQKDILKRFNVDYVFGHLEIGGCMTSSKGNMLKTNTTIQEEDFKSARVFAGHIHIRQKIQNVNYIGTPYMKDRGDIGNEKGITLLHLQSGATKFIENKFSPRFIKESVYDILDQTVAELKERWKNNFVDVIVKNDDLMNCKLDKLRETLLGTYKEFKLIGESTTQGILENKEIELSEAKSSSEYIDDFLDQVSIDDDLRDEIKNKLQEYAITGS